MATEPHSAPTQPHSPIDDPPLGQCPVWCEKPVGHGWEDEWEDGPVRLHTRRRGIGQYDAIEVTEIEQFIASGTVREREIELGGATWNIPTAHKILALLTEALDIAGDGTLP